MPVQRCTGDGDCVHEVRADDRRIAPRVVVTCRVVYLSYQSPMNTLHLRASCRVCVVCGVVAVPLLLSSGGVLVVGVFSRDCHALERCADGTRPRAESQIDRGVTCTHLSQHNTAHTVHYSHATPCIMHQLRFKQQRRHASTIQQGSVRLAGAYDKRSGRRLSSLVSAASASVSVRY